MLYNKDWAYKLNPVADTLMKAADLLERYGHTKWVRMDERGSMCFLGALQAAQDDDDHQDTDVTVEASGAVASLLGLKKINERHPDYRGSIAAWNNEDERTGEEVIDAMRKTALKLLENADAV